jgi:8-oxo-dGTP diphosphatase
MAEVLLVHRPGPGYDDWTFPKGKLLAGEEPVEGALREVEEETGLKCRVQRFFGRTSYTDRKDRPKVVDYWVMEPVEGRFRPNVEVDTVRWLTVDEALELLTYPRDRDLLAEFAGITFRRLIEA